MSNDMHRKPALDKTHQINYMQMAQAQGCLGQKSAQIFSAARGRQKKKKKEKKKRVKSGGTKAAHTRKTTSRIAWPASSTSHQLTMPLVLYTLRKTIAHIQTQ